MFQSRISHAPTEKAPDYCSDRGSAVSPVRAAGGADALADLIGDAGRGAGRDATKVLECLVMSVGDLQRRHRLRKAWRDR
eukprot:SAG11_NODE_13429_length_655_cov_1.473022_1_plen_80_part_00